MKADNGGLRYDMGKPMLHLIPPDGLLELAKVYTRACTPMEGYPEGKYPKRNWERGMDWSKVTDSLERHLAAFKMGEDTDAETGLLHTAQLVWNAMALLVYQLRKIGVDDRHKLEQPRITLKRLHEMADELGISRLVGWQDILREAYPDSSWKRFISQDKAAPNGDCDATISGYVKDGHLYITDVKTVEKPGPLDMGENEAPLLDPQMVEPRVGLQFRLTKGAQEVWEITEILRSLGGGTGRFRAKCVNDERPEQMMTIRAIAEIVNSEPAFTPIVGDHVQLTSSATPERWYYVSAVDGPVITICDSETRGYCFETTIRQVGAVRCTGGRKTSHRCMHCPADAVADKELCHTCAMESGQ